MLCPQSAALLFVTFRKEIYLQYVSLTSYIILHHPTSPEACRNMNDNDKCITCSLVLAGSSNSRRSTVQRHVQYSPSMSKVSECKLKRHQLLHGSSNTLPISPPNTANISSKHIKEIYKRTTTRPQTTRQCDSLP